MTSKDLAEFLFRDTKYNDSRDTKEWKDQVIMSVTNLLDKFKDGTLIKDKYLCDNFKK